MASTIDTDDFAQTLTLLRAQLDDLHRAHRLVNKPEALMGMLDEGMKAFLASPMAQEHPADSLISLSMWAALRVMADFVATSPCSEDGLLGDMVEWLTVAIEALPSDVQQSDEGLRLKALLLARCALMIRVPQQTLSENYWADAQRLLDSADRVTALGAFPSLPTTAAQTIRKEALRLQSTGQSQAQKESRRIRVVCYSILGVFVVALIIFALLVYTM